MDGRWLTVASLLGLTAAAAARRGSSGVVRRTPSKLPKPQKPPHPVVNTWSTNDPLWKIRCDDRGDLCVYVFADNDVDAMEYAEEYVKGKRWKIREQDVSPVPLDEIEEARVRAWVELQQQEHGSRGLVRAGRQKPAHMSLVTSTDVVDRWPDRWAVSGEPRQSPIVVARGLPAERKISTETPETWWINPVPMPDVGVYQALGKSAAQSYLRGLIVLDNLGGWMAPQIDDPHASEEADPEAVVYALKRGFTVARIPLSMESHDKRYRWFVLHPIPEHQRSWYRGPRSFPEAHNDMISEALKDARMLPAGYTTPL